LTESDGVAATDLGKYFAVVRDNIRGPIPFHVSKYDDASALIFGCAEYSHDFKSLRLIVLALGSLRASIILTVAGATPQVTALLRHALESAMYAYLFFEDVEYYNKWRQREESLAAKREARNFLTFGGMLKVVKGKDPRLAKTIEEIYDFLITFGAHPNVAQVAPLVEYQFDEGAELGQANLKMLVSDTERDAISIWICYTYEVVMRIFQKIWPDEYASLGIEAGMRDAYFHLKLFRAQKKA
jgi:hypothetical protein